MNLVVDIGNSSTKLALVDDNMITRTQRSEMLSGQEILGFIKNLKISKAIISSVKDVPDNIRDIIHGRTDHLHILSHKSLLPYKITYKTPETLGTDRIAAVAGAYFHFPGSDSLIIDAGTAITFDFLEGSVYTGGNISPGIDTRFKALHHFTGKLPLITNSREFNSPGSGTKEAIIAGVVSGVIFEINEYIRTFKEKHMSSKIILTGGDGIFLKDHIEGRINHMPDIVIVGLNYILEYNAN